MCPDSTSSAKSHKAEDGSPRCLSQPQGCALSSTEGMCRAAGLLGLPALRNSTGGTHRKLSRGSWLNMDGSELGHFWEHRLPSCVQPSRCMTPIPGVSPADPRELKELEIANSHRCVPGLYGQS